MKGAVSHSVRTEVRESLWLSVPLIAAQLAQMSMGLIDTLMIGRLGSTALAAGALGAAVFFPVSIICVGLLSAVSPMVSQAFGARRDEPIRRTVRQGFWLATIAAVPVFFLYRNASGLLLWMGQSAEVVELTHGYLMAVSWGIFPNLWFAVLRNLVESVSRPRPVMVVTVCAIGLNIFWNYVLMFGKLGFPALGIVGTGISTVIVYSAMFLSLAAYVRFARPIRGYDVFRQLRRPDPAYLKELIRIGWPVGVMHGAEAGLFSVTALLIGLIDTMALAAHQIAIQCAAFAFMVPLGIGIATSVRVGQATGRGDPDAARRAGFVGMALGAAFMCVTAASFLLFPRFIISLYIDTGVEENLDVVAFGVGLLGVAAAFQVFDGVQVTAAGALRGLKDTRVPMIISLIAYWLVGMSSGYTLGFVLGLGARGLWWGLVLGLAVAAVLLSARFYRTMENSLQQPPDGREVVPPRTEYPVTTSFEQE